MLYFHTSLTIERNRDALELLALAEDAESDDELDPTVEVDIEVEVTYSPGWHDPGSWHEPPSGEDPEIESVIVLLESGYGEDIYSKLSRTQFDQLVQKAWDHQAEHEREMGYDPDAYDRARDQAMEDDWHDGHY